MDNNDDLSRSDYKFTGELLVKGSHIIFADEEIISFLDLNHSPVGMNFEDLTDISEGDVDRIQHVVNMLQQTSSQDEEYRYLENYKVRYKSISVEPSLSMVRLESIPVSDKYLHEFETLITLISRDLITAGTDLDATIDRVLGKLGLQMNVDRTYIFRTRGQTMDNINEWVADSVEPMIEQLQQVPRDYYSWLDSQLSQKKVINIYNIDDLPSEAERDKILLKEQHIKSLLIIPLHYGDEYLGFIGFDSTTRHQQWEESTVSLLKILGDIVIYSLKKMEIEQKLVRSEEKYRSLFQNSIDAIYISSIEGSLKEFNQSFVDLLGYSRDELETVDVSKLYANSEDRKRLLELATENSQIHNLEVNLRHKNGDIIHGLLSAEILTENGQPKGFHGVIKDITELRQAEDVLNKADKLNSLGIMAGGIAHDFNNLLVSILGYTELARSISEDGEVRGFLDRIYQSANRASQLTNKLLTYAGKGEVYLDIKNLQDEVRNHFDEYRKLVPENISFQHNLQSTGWVDMDFTQINQVVHNLILNAAEAMAGENGHIHLSTGVQTGTTIEQEEHQLLLQHKISEGSYSFIRVRDTGPGIHVEDIQKIFEPYFSTKFQGRGLGLSASWGIVKNHNGLITVSTNDRGTIFSLYLPQTTKPKMGDQPVANNGIGRALVVDDQHSVREMICTLVRHFGWTSVRAKNGAEALDKINSEDFDLIILDQSMPNMKGTEIITELRKRGNNTPVVLSSGYSKEELKQHIKDKSIEGFLQKPFSIADLKQILDNI